MADIVDRRTRSRMMSRIRGRDTRPELLLRSALRRRGLTGYRCHWRAAPGRPDIAFPGRRIAIFVDGAFWHGHPEYYTFGKSGEAWDQKIRRNIERDKEVDAQLFDLGWRSCRVWDFEILANADAVASRLAALVKAVPQGRATEAASRRSREPRDPA
jgi:DNA mismatch endonuclease, patch repair protein